MRLYFWPVHRLADGQWYARHGGFLFELDVDPAADTVGALKARLWEPWGGGRPRERRELALAPAGWAERADGRRLPAEDVAIALRGALEDGRTLQECGLRPGADIWAFHIPLQDGAGQELSWQVSLPSLGSEPAVDGQECSPRPQGALGPLVAARPPEALAAEALGPPQEALAEEQRRLWAEGERQAEAEARAREQPAAELREHERLVGELQGQLRSMEEQLQAKQQEVVILQEQLQAASELRAQHLQQLAELREHLQTQDSQCKQRIAELEEQLESQEEGRQQGEDQSRRQLSELEQQLSARCAQVAALEEQLGREDMRMQQQATVYERQLQQARLAAEEQQQQKEARMADLEERTSALRDALAAKDRFSLQQERHIALLEQRLEQLPLKGAAPQGVAPAEQVRARAPSTDSFSPAFQHTLGARGADPQGKRTLFVQCPGVVEVDFEVVPRGYGVRATLRGLESACFPAPEWSKEFDFDAPDGPFELVADESRLQHGLLALVFKPQRQVFRLQSDHHGLQPLAAAGNLLGLPSEESAESLSLWQAVPSIVSPGVSGAPVVAAAPRAAKEGGLGWQSPELPVSVSDRSLEGWEKVSVAWTMHTPVTLVSAPARLEQPHPRLSPAAVRRPCPDMQQLPEQRGCAHGAAGGSKICGASSATHSSGARGARSASADSGSIRGNARGSG